MFTQVSAHEIELCLALGSGQLFFASLARLFIQLEGSPSVTLLTDSNA